MPKRKQPDLLDRLVGSFSLRGLMLHPATLFVAASVGLISGVTFLWNHHQATIVDINQFQLTDERVTLNEPPVWADRDLRKLVVEADENQQRSLLDPDLVSETASRMQRVGFVERVNQIVKSRDGLKVDLSYRQPVATIEISTITIPELKQQTASASGRTPTILLPVDRSGVLMPRDLALETGLPQLCMLYPANIQPGQSINLTTWSDVDDIRIRESSAIASYLKGQTEQMGVHRILCFNDPDEARNEAEYELWSTRNRAGGTVQWGHAPGREASDEATPEQKLAALKALIEQLGPLDRLGPRRFDLRSGQAVEIPRDKVAHRIRGRLRL